MPRIESSMMSFAAYDERAHTLTLTFASGDRYEYLDVPKQIYLDLLSAASAGVYFDRAIRDRFRYQRLGR
jgi:hypothetical protein